MGYRFNHIRPLHIRHSSHRHDDWFHANGFKSSKRKHNKGKADMKFKILVTVNGEEPLLIEYSDRRDADIALDILETELAYVDTKVIKLYNDETGMNHYGGGGE